MPKYADIARPGYLRRYMRRLPLTMLVMGIVEFLVMQTPTALQASVELYPDMSPGAYWAISFLTGAFLLGPLANLVVAVFPKRSRQ